MSEYKNKHGIPIKVHEMGGKSIKPSDIFNSEKGKSILRRYSEHRNKYPQHYFDR